MKDKKRAPPTPKREKEKRALPLHSQSQRFPLAGGNNMTLKELKTQLLALTPTEQAEAIEILNKMINSDSSRITKTAGVCGGEACVENTRIPVWLLVSLRHQGSTDAELLSFYPQLRAGDLVNAWAYAKAYPEEIETAIKEEEEVMELEI